MSTFAPSVQSRIARFAKATEGAAAVTAALFMTVAIGLAGFVIDIGHVMAVQRQLQASTDAAALAGAHHIADGSATTFADTYSSIIGGKNAIKGVTVTMPAGYPKLKCLTSTGVGCSGSPSANAIQVKQQATVPMWFAQVLGISSIPISTTATASAGGGSPISADIELVLDTTGSMNNGDKSCSIKNATRLSCAQAGVRTLLNQLQPAGDRIGLTVFPGVSSSTAAKNYDCTSSNPTVVSYKSNPTYSILNLGNDFKASNASTSLDNGSNLVKTVGGVSGCTGLSAVGGVGTFFADAITSAQNKLNSQGRSNVQKVMIILSDGDAGASSSNMPNGKASNQCLQAVNAAASAKSAGIWVFSIAYGASTSQSSSCGTDFPKISACQTMSQIASDPSYFYSDSQGQYGGCTSTATSVTELVSVFNHIGQALGAPRLIPDDTN